mmetsp:Transcript_6400/g.15078  ORF Transcript_6400/g.15078 Transcript_6400/m.15078 type:complete len:380 (+) Transcript_6400:1349-2488(+)
MHSPSLLRNRLLCAVAGPRALQRRGLLFDGRKGAQDALRSLPLPPVPDSQVPLLQRVRHLGLARRPAPEGVGVAPLHGELLGLVGDVFLRVVRHLAGQQQRARADPRPGFGHAVEAQLRGGLQVAAPEDQRAFLHGVGEQQRGVVHHRAALDVLQIILAAHGRPHEAHVPADLRTHKPVPSRQEHRATQGLQEELVCIKEYCLEGDPNGIAQAEQPDLAGPKPTGDGPLEDGNQQNLGRHGHQHQHRDEGPSAHLPAHEGPGLRDDQPRAEVAWDVSSHVQDKLKQQEDHLVDGIDPASNLHLIWHRRPLHQDVGQRIRVVAHGHHARGQHLVSGDADAVTHDGCLLHTAAGLQNHRVCHDRSALQHDLVALLLVHCCS